MRADELRLGVVGVGARAQLATYAPAAGARIVAAADPAERAREQAHELYGDGVAVVADHRELLDAGLDGVFVLTPDDAHASVAVPFLEAGVPVYLEKPMATTLNDCDAILAAQARSGTLLVPGHNMRHMPIVTEMKRLIDDGAIGTVKTVWCRHFVGHGGDYYFKDWHADASRATGLLLQKGAHDIDVIHWLGGGHTDLVTGMGALQVYGDITDRRDNSDRRMRDWFSYDNWPPTSQRDLNPVVDVEDTSMLQMHLGNGVLASYTQCHFTPDYWRNYTVIGTAGRLENFGDLDGGEIRVWNRRTDYDGAGHLTVPVSAGIDGHGGADALIVAEFCAALRGEATPRTSALDARAAVATGVCGTESIRSGSVPVRIPEPRLGADDLTPTGDTPHRPDLDQEASGSVSTDDVPRVALIGAGGIASVHIDAWLALGADVRVYSHGDAENLVSAHGGGTPVTTREEAFDGADLVDITTPTYTHGEVAGAAFAAGLDVICEKPLAVTAAEAAELVDQAATAAVGFYPAHVVRFFPAYAAMRDHVAAGGVGDVAVQRFTRIGSRPVKPWFADPHLSGGIVMDQMIHDLDFARWTAGEVVRVFARQASTPDQADRLGVISAQVALTHASGALSYVTGTWAAPGTAFRTTFEVAGSDGFVRHDSAEHAPLRLDGGAAGEGRGLLPGTSFDESPYLTQLRELLAAVRGEQTSRVSARDGLEAVRIAEAANVSLGTGDAVELATILEHAS
ncbi:hypothetical protein GCM10023169_31980 [Georgenia halophila]|uniref:Dehydrogenase n=1 Tax=Georgenia halophila TaxID=620889 RepID=A0ABP8LI86_9MICO